MSQEVCVAPFGHRCGSCGSTGGNGTVINFPQPAIVKPEDRTLWGSYDISTGGIPLPLPLDIPHTYTEQQITFSTASYRRSTDPTFLTSAGTTTTFRRLLRDQDRIVMQTDTGLILHEGNDTAFTEEFLYSSPITGVIDQLELSFAVGVNVSAFTNGSVTINSVTVTPRSFFAAAAIDGFNQSAYTPTTIAVASAFTALTATGTQIFIVKAVLNTPMRVYQNQPFGFTITINETSSGTNTRQIGLVPIFPYQATDVFKKFYESEIIAHFRPLPEAADTLTGATNMGISSVVNPK
jgi:hypothetical protein